MKKIILSIGILLSAVGCASAYQPPMDPGYPDYHYELDEPIFYYFNQNGVNIEGDNVHIEGEDWTGGIQGPVCTTNFWLQWNPFYYNY